jgi:hypothetical protein
VRSVDVASLKLWYAHGFRANDDQMYRVQIVDLRKRACWSKAGVEVMRRQWAELDVHRVRIIYRGGGNA